MTEILVRYVGCGCEGLCLGHLQPWKNYSDHFVSASKNTDIINSEYSVKSAAIVGNIDKINENELTL